MDQVYSCATLTIVLSHAMAITNNPVLECKCFMLPDNVLGMGIGTFTDV